VLEKRNCVQNERKAWPGRGRGARILYRREDIVIVKKLTAKEKISFGLEILSPCCKSGNVGT